MVAVCLQEYYLDASGTGVCAGVKSVTVDFGAEIKSKLCFR